MLAEAKTFLGRHEDARLACFEIPFERPDGLSEYLLTSTLSIFFLHVQLESHMVIVVGDAAMVNDRHRSTTASEDRLRQS